MLVTLDTSHFEMSPLNDFAEANMSNMSATPETSHDPIGPCEPLEQSESPPFRHALMAVWSCAFDFGAKPVALCYCMGPFGFTVVARVRVWVRIKVSVKIGVRVDHEVG